jgi:4'-phosphopantetheinyl transferase
MVQSNTLLWFSDIGALTPAWFDSGAGWLAESEHLRCGRFTRAERRRQFIAARVLLRLALGRLLGVPPRTVTLRDRVGDSPVLVEPECPNVCFSIAHSGQWVACAVSVCAPVGLDIERLDPTRDLISVASHAFGPETAAKLAELRAEARIPAFYSMWCRYEAHVKLGISGRDGRHYDYFFELPGLAAVLSSTQEIEAESTLIDVAGFEATAWPRVNSKKRN